MAGAAGPDPPGGMRKLTVQPGRQPVAVAGDQIVHQNDSLARLDGILVHLYGRTVLPSLSRTITS